MKKLTNKSPGTVYATLKSREGNMRNVVLPAGFSEKLLPGEVLVTITAPDDQYSLT